jgi:hypothetical protein
MDKHIKNSKCESNNAIVLENPCEEDGQMVNRYMKIIMHIADHRDTQIKNINCHHKLCRQLHF